MSNAQKYIISEDQPALVFIQAKRPRQSLTSIKQLFKHHCIFVNGSPVSQTSYPLKAGDCLQICSAKDSRFGFNHPKLSIIFEDDFILAVDKASGLHSVDSTGHGVENAASLLEKYLKRRSPEKRIYIVHRLDRDTSGVMIFAKTREAQNILVSDWNNRVIERTYIAIAEGRIEPSEGTIESYLYEDNHKIMHSTQNPEIGLHAVTHFKVLKTTNTYTQLKLNLETGRTNQIRVHLQSIGHPIIGDAKYGAQTDPIHRLGLHAFNIRVYHPVTNKILSFESPLPDVFGFLAQSRPSSR